MNIWLSNLDYRSEKALRYGQPVTINFKAFANIVLADSKAYKILSLNKIFTLISFTILIASHYLYYKSIIVVWTIVVEKEAIDEPPPKVDLRD